MSVWLLAVVLLISGCATQRPVRYVEVFWQYTPQEGLDGEELSPAIDNTGEEGGAYYIVPAGYMKRLNDKYKEGIAYKVIKLEELP